MGIVKLLKKARVASELGKSIKSLVPDINTRDNTGKSSLDYYISKSAIEFITFATQKNENQTRKRHSNKNIDQC